MITVDVFVDMDHLFGPSQAGSVAERLPVAAVNNNELWRLMGEVSFADQDALRDARVMVSGRGIELRSRAVVHFH